MYARLRRRDRHGAKRRQLQPWCCAYKRSRRS